jgi:uncharacterized protein
MDGSALMWAASGLFLAGVVKGATGLGYASCALPFLVPIVGLKTAMALVLTPTIVSNIQVVLTAGHFRECLFRFRWLYIAMMPGISIGLVLLAHIDSRIATSILGLSLVLYVGFALAKPDLTLPQALHGPLQWPVGFLNGVVTGLTGSQVMPLFPYVMSLGLDPARIVQTVNIGVTAASTVTGLGLVMSGLVTRDVAVLSLAAIGPAMLGVAMGTRAREHIPAARFRSIVLWFVGALGLSLVVR